MPSFIVYAPDYPNSLAKRLAVREEHLARVKQEIASGVHEYGRPFLPPPDAQPHGLNLPPGTPNIGGSLSVYKMPSREAVWERIKADVYWTAGVWDKDRVFVEECIP
ncbi:hypothetical protein Q5752_002173 [Cryptotrichosporon argae]